MHSIMSEILAPAGDEKCALAAINAGADAIYLGLARFSARNSAANFDIDSFNSISQLARAFGVKIYVAMNTLVKDCELEEFLKTVIQVWNSGADAIIISDIFLGKFIKEQYPEINLHLSTQAGICNVYGAMLAKQYGFSRVILSRETAIEDIQKITEIIETEVFIQGALCTAFSGQCYLSSFAGGNSGNRGRCKQPCRKLYSINRAGFDNYAYRLSLSDLCVGNDIKKFLDAGVTSFKIEGRMRRPEYVSAAVKYYRHILDGKESHTDFSDLKRAYNRGNFTKGLTFGQDNNFISSSVQGHIGEFVGTLKVQKGKYICLSAERFQKGDCFKVLRDGKEVCGADFVENCSDGFIIGSKVKLYSGDKIFITTDTDLNDRLLSLSRKIKIEISANFFVGQTAKIIINGEEIFLGETLQPAINRPLDFTDFKKCFDKVDKFPFETSYKSFETDGVFINAAELNRIRREAYEMYFAKISANKNRKLDLSYVLPHIKTESNEKTAIISPDFKVFHADINIFKPADYNNISINSFANDIGNRFLYLPPFMTGEELKKVESIAEYFDGIYCDGVWACEFTKKINKMFFAGCGLNISNRVDLVECPAEYITLSKELTFNEQKSLSTSNTFALSTGNIKVMDLVYCPFEKKCKVCDKRSAYVLTDEEGRKFPILRYTAGSCRFEVFNCVNLVGVSPTGTLVDASFGINGAEVLKICKDEQMQQKFYKKYTRGHSHSPVL